MAYATTSNANQALHVLLSEHSSKNLCFLFLHYWHADTVDHYIRWSWEGPCTAQHARVVYSYTNDWLSALCSRRPITNKTVVSHLIMLQWRRFLASQQCNRVQLDSNTLNSVSALFEPDVGIPVILRTVVQTLLIRFDRVRNWWLFEKTLRFLKVVAFKRSIYYMKPLFNGHRQM